MGYRITPGICRIDTPAPSSFSFISLVMALTRSAGSERALCCVKCSTVNAAEDQRGQNLRPAGFTREPRQGKRNQDSLWSDASSYPRPGLLCGHAAASVRYPVPGQIERTAQPLALPSSGGFRKATHRSTWSCPCLCRAVCRISMPVLSQKPARLRWRKLLATIQRFDRW